MSDRLSVGPARSFTTLDDGARAVPLFVESLLELMVVVVVVSTRVLVEPLSVGSPLELMIVVVEVDMSMPAK
jgi:hypothetical protein